MNKRGRKSTAQMTVVSIESAIKHPEPPNELTEEMKLEWKAVVNRLPPDWFSRETHSLLTQYCRHILAARRVAQLIEHIEKSEDFNYQDYDQLLRMQERESRNISSLATRMRITQQAKYSHKTAHTAAKNYSNTKKPWEQVRTQ